MHLRSGGGSSKEEEKSLNQILCTQAIQIGILIWKIVLENFYVKLFSLTHNPRKQVSILSRKKQAYYK